MQQLSTFLKGRMNKSDDERIIPDGEYINALNVRAGSTEDSEVGALEKAKGNELLTDIDFLGTALSVSAKCVGAYPDEENDRIFWFINDPNNGDIIVSYNILSGNITYHVNSVSVLNLNSTYLINSINLIGDLLFWTDNYNPPRRINVNSSYADPLGGVDIITEEEINVILKPPSSAPSLNFLIENPADQGELVENFLCFGYRYKYINNEYSAISQFTGPAFLPTPVFDFDYFTGRNIGMRSIYNALEVTVNTGSSLVKEVQLCWKNSSNDVIKVANTYVKEKEGWTDNSLKSVYFNNKQIQEVLSSDEILRIFDNVPLLANSQTFMSNRLMYGNYVDGYDLIDSSNQSININFTSELFNFLPDVDFLQQRYIEPAIQYTYFTNIPSNVSPDLSSGGSNPTILINPGDYVVKSGAGTATVNPAGTKTEFDFTGYEFKAGDRFVFSFNLSLGPSQSVFFQQDAAVLNLERTTAVFKSFTIEFTLQNSYPTAYDFFNSTELQSAFGKYPNSSPSWRAFPDAGGALSSTAPGTTAVDRMNEIFLQNPATDTVSSTSKTAVNSSGQDANNALFPAAPYPAYPTGQTGVFYDIVASPAVGNTILKVQLPMAVYNTAGPAGTYSYEVAKISGAFAYIDSGVFRQSLHSNRDYDIGIIYMDEYGRSTPALTSPNSSFKVPANNSVFINKAKTTIPPSLKPPSWAKKFKFAIKPSATDYDTIYASYILPSTSDSSMFWILLNGENAAAVQQGQDLIVKSDGSGPKASLVKVKVLEKSTSPDVDTGVTGWEAPPGVWVRFNQQANFSINTNSTLPVVRTTIANYSVFTYGNDSYPEAVATVLPPSAPIQNSNNFAIYVSPFITKGTRVTISAEFNSPNEGGIGTTTSQCQKGSRSTIMNISRTAPIDYAGSTIIDSLVNFINAEWIDSATGYFIDPAGTFNAGTFNVDNKFPIKFDAGKILTHEFAGNTSPGGDYHVISLNTTNIIDGTPQGSIGAMSNFYTCGLQSSSVTISLTISKPLQEEELVILETEAEEASPDFFYESASSYDIVNNLHKGNIQEQKEWTFGDNAQNNAYRALAGLPASPGGFGGDVAFTTNPAAPFNLSGLAHTYSVGDVVLISQTDLTPINPQYNGFHNIVEIPDQYTIVIDVPFGSSTPVEGGTANSPAIVLNDFFNCYSWGQGTESMYIDDSSLNGDKLTIGNRVYGSTEQDFKKIRRNASITYSGTFNEQSNINRLNEFNQGILNFKDLNQTFGGIQIMDARQTDVLVLQEDKISYVLAGKDQLTQADGGVSLTSIPEVLGTQIARIEKYGISFNPESYVQYGFNKYFTDQKRGAVLELIGSDRNEQLNVVSFSGMRSWFRDLFIASPTTQKLGGFDPYLSEYVLSSNDTQLPLKQTLFQCNTTVSRKKAEATVNYDVELGLGLGTVNIPFNVTAGAITIKAIYNGTTHNSGAVTGTGTFSFDKDSVQSLVDITITNPNPSLPATYTVETQCPSSDVINVVFIGIRSSNITDISKNITTSMYFENGSYKSPVRQSNLNFGKYVAPVGTAGQNVIQNETVTGLQGVNVVPIDGTIGASASSVVTLGMEQLPTDTYVIDSSVDKLSFHWSDTAYDPANPTDVNTLLGLATDTTLFELSTNSFEGKFTFDPSPSKDYLYLIYNFFN